MSVYIEHDLQGVARLSRVLSWQSHVIPIGRPSVIHGGALSQQSVSLGMSLAAVVALNDAASNCYRPVLVQVDENSKLEFVEDETDYGRIQDRL